MTLLVVLEMVWLAGCASPALPSETYMLDARIAPRKAVGRGSRALLVAMPQAQPGFDTRRIAYTKTPLTLDYYANSEWADTPARLLAPLIVRALESTGGFRAVVAAPASVSGDIRMDIDVIRFQQEFLEQPSRMRIILRARLIDLITLQVMATQLFEAVEIAPSENAYGGVQAANTALGRLLGELAEFALTHASGGEG